MVLARTSLGRQFIPRSLLRSERIAHCKVQPRVVLMTTCDVNSDDTVGIIKTASFRYSWMHCITLQKIRIINLCKGENSHYSFQAFQLNHWFLKGLTLKISMMHHIFWKPECRYLQDKSPVIVYRHVDELRPRMCMESAFEGIIKTDVANKAHGEIIMWYLYMYTHLQIWTDWCHTNVIIMYIRADCGLTPSQWEMSLQSNGVSH